MRILFILAGFAAATVQAEDPAGWTLQWSDEFAQADGTAPDPAKWSYDLGGSGWGNNELEYYTSRRENSRIEGGALVIEAREESEGGRDYTSARLVTRGKWEGTYGRIEARMRLPRGQGIWPAFWALGTNFEEVGWPACGEIDIMENIGREPSIVHGTLHGPGYSGARGLSGKRQLATGALADEYHVFGIEWDPGRIRWMLDGQQFFSLTPANMPAGGVWVFNRPHYLLLNLAVGGNWPGNPDGTTVFPQQLLVDYVRIYSRDEVDPPAADLHVTVDPAATWLGYMNVSELPANGGTYRFGRVWPTTDLSAVFNGPTLRLTPNSITDPSTYWYVGGGAPGHPGNKRMSANMYVEKGDSFSGRTVVFSGAVTEATLAGSHQAVAFIKDFAPDYSSMATVTAPLTPGNFELRLQTTPGAGRHVQYGFEVTGPNVWSTDVAALGSVKVTAAAADPFVTWITRFNFVPGADVSATGDPDGDGRTNLAEFALDDDPTSGRASVKTRSQMVDGNGVLFTFPVHGNAVFVGDLAKTATVGQAVYQVEGSADLVNFDRGVTEVAVAAEGMPALSAGWSYRTFRLASETSRGFLRVRISPAP